MTVPWQRECYGRTLLFFTVIAPLLELNHYFSKAQKRVFQHPSLFSADSKYIIMHIILAKLYLLPGI